MVGANNIIIIIIMNFGDLPLQLIPTTSAGGWAYKKKVPSRSTLLVGNGGICLVAGFPVVTIGPSMVAGKVASMGPAIMISFEFTS